MGPTWSKVCTFGQTPTRLTRPCVGLRPTMPQKAAGLRMDPPVSEPSATVHIPAAAAAADPPLGRRLEPPDAAGAGGFADGPPGIRAERERAHPRRHGRRGPAARSP